MPRVTPQATTTAPTFVNFTDPFTVIGPANAVFSERQIGDTYWPSDLILDLKQWNWIEWSRRLTLVVDENDLSGYLKGTLSCPDITLYPAAHEIWTGNDRSLRAFMLLHVASDEFDVVSAFDTSHTVFEELRTRHENPVPRLFAQMDLLRKALDIYYEPSVPMATTTKELLDVYERFRKMGKIDEDKLLIVFIINSLGRHYPQLQSLIYCMADDPNFTTSLALKRIENEAALEARRAEMASITSAKYGKIPSVVCSNCKRPHHTIEFWVKPGGRMAGRSLDEAKAAQRAAAGNLPRNPRPATTV
ncbi:hypothetical protein BC827DRAFT_1267733 [Russula dissimulans]|nr:hypothetical protein BC827DRAFT_1267733 [Russula dissimulans]